MIQPNIDMVRYYACGYCVNHMGFIVKNPKEKKRAFPAGVYLLHHVKYGYILFDTGYSERNYKCGWKGILYRLLNPTHITKKETLAEQLRKDGIAAKDIRYIILSHLHPDHIGGLKDFPNAKLVCSMDCFKQYKRGRLFDLIFTDLLPDDFEKRLYRVRKYDSKYAFFDGYDLFRDGSVILTDISGHSAGQMGAYLWEYRIFLGADAAWGLEFLGRAEEMSKPARLVQYDFRAYQKTMETIRKMIDARVSVYLSHERNVKKDLIHE